jgi:hypothetical protein
MPSGKKATVAKTSYGNRTGQTPIPMPVAESGKVVDHNVIRVGPKPIMLHIRVGHDYISHPSGQATQWIPSRKDLEEVKAAFASVTDIPVVVTHTGVNVTVVTTMKENNHEW